MRYLLEITVLSVLSSIIQVSYAQILGKQIEFFPVNEIAVPQNSFVKVKDYSKVITNRICIWNGDRLIQLQDSSKHTLDPQLCIKIDPTSLLAVSTCCGKMIIDSTKKSCTICQNNAQCPDIKRFQCVNGMCIRRCDQHSRIVGDKCGRGLVVITDIHEFLPQPSDQKMQKFTNIVSINSDSSQNRSKIINKVQQINSQSKAHQKLQQQQQNVKDSYDSLTLLLLIVVISGCTVLLVILLVICYKVKKQNNEQQNRLPKVTSMSVQTIQHSQSLQNGIQVANWRSNPYVLTILDSAINSINQ